MTTTRHYDKQGREYIPLGRLGDGLGERLMGAASPDDYWPLPPVQEPTGALNPADPHTALGGSGVDAHRDAEVDHEPGEQPGWAIIVGAAVGIIVAVLGIAACTAIGALGLLQ